MQEREDKRPNVGVRAVEHAGASRLVFDWPTPIGCKLQRRGDYLVITFDRPGDVDVTSLPEETGGSVIGAMVEEEGQRVILMTRGDLDIEVQQDERHALVVDLIAPSDEPLITPAKLDRPTVETRAAEHPGFSRLVFDWPAAIGHDVQQTGDQIIVTFDRPGEMDVASLVAGSGGRLIDARAEDKGRRVILTTRGRLDMRVRDYEDDLLVLDLADNKVTVSTDDVPASDESMRTAVSNGIGAEPSPSRRFVSESRETSPTPRPADGRQDVAVQPATAPGQFDVDEDALDRALERTLTREGVLLLPAGKIEITPSFTYRRRESRAPTQVDLFGLFAQVRETEIRRDEFDIGLAIDVGLPFDAQLELSQTFRHVDQMTMTSAGFVGLEESNETADAFDDLVVGLAKGLLHENGWWPDLVARVTWDSNTGKERDGNIGLGGGSHELTGSLSFLKTRDPLAFFGGVSYGHTFEEDGFNPGDQIGVSLGTTLAAGPDTSLRLALNQSFISKAEINGTSIPGSRETSASLTAGASLVLGRGVLLDSSVTAGLTDDAPDYSARIALPVRFDPF